MQSKTKIITALSLGVALAMILSFVESQIPPLAAVPGVKIGLSNIVTVTLLYVMGAPWAGAVSLARVFLSTLLFGNSVALIYSLSGAVLSFVSMLLAKRFTPFSAVGVSVIGGVTHNIGQVIAASVVMENAAIVYYLAPLLISGVLAGVGVGVVSGIVAKRLSGILK